MKEGPTSATPRLDISSGELTTDQAMESAALAGAAAIQRLVADRNGLRHRLSVQERELVALRSLNEELRRRLVLIHQHYVDLAKKFVSQLEQFDGTIREVAQGGSNGSGHREEAVASLAQRLERNAPGAATSSDGSEPASS